MSFEKLDASVFLKFNIETAAGNIWDTRQNNMGVNRGLRDSSLNIVHANYYFESERLAIFQIHKI